MEVRLSRWRVVNSECGLCDNNIDKEGERARARSRLLDSKFMALQIYTGGRSGMNECRSFVV